MLGDKLLNELAEASIEAHKFFHFCAGQVLKKGDEVRWVATAHNLDKIITEVH